MKVIFLDIDGVLNCQSSKSKYRGLIGIDNKKVKVLRRIVELTSAKIILCSSWETGWRKTEKELQGTLASYLDMKLDKECWHIFDKTDDSGSDRGHGIRRYLENNPQITHWCVIDNDIFIDYEECGIMDHLVKISFYDNNGGLQEEHIDKVVEMLNR